MEDPGLLPFLLGLMTEERRHVLSSVVLERTRHLSVVLENIFQSHNTSAVLRSCECFGIQDVHVIENHNAYKTHKDIALGSDKWLSIYRYKGVQATADCLNKLKKNGYCIVATTPHEAGYQLENLPIDQKLALVFGTEMEGISQEAGALADYFVKIPMHGFTESLNISVTAALMVYCLQRRIRESSLQWRLTKQEQEEILLSWARVSIKKAEVVEQEYFRRKAV